MQAKRLLYAQNFEEMTEEDEIEEERRFRLMDYNNCGFITWNAFIEFEAANLISKKNKVSVLLVILLYFLVYHVF
jgi:hypothetical protein